MSDICMCSHSYIALCCKLAHQLQPAMSPVLRCLSVHAVHQADMLCTEELSGDNQYHCDFCGKKVDATRQLCLRQLPPYLCLSLKRFVFDMKVTAYFLLNQ